MALWGTHTLRMAAKEAIGLALATQEFGARFFSNGARPGIVLSHPSQLSEKARDNIQRSWNAAHAGLERSHRVAILEEGMKIETFGVPPEEAQFLECVAPGTLVTMADGTRKPVESLQPGDVVIGWNGGLVPAKVKAVGSPQSSRLCES